MAWIVSSKTKAFFFFFLHKDACQVNETKKNKTLYCFGWLGLNYKCIVFFLPWQHGHAVKAQKWTSTQNRGELNAFLIFTSKTVVQDLPRMIIRHVKYIYIFGNVFTPKWQSQLRFIASIAGKGLCLFLTLALHQIWNLELGPGTLNLHSYHNVEVEMQNILYSLNWFCERTVF